MMTAADTKPWVEAAPAVPAANPATTIRRIVRGRSTFVIFPPKQTHHKRLLSDVGPEFAKGCISDEHTEQGARITSLCSRMANLWAAYKRSQMPHAAAEPETAS